MLFRIAPFLIFLFAASVAAAAPSDEQAIQFFESRVRPVLTDHCYKCHSDAAKKLKGELHLDSREGVLAGGKSGIVVVPGHPEQSLLVEAIHYANPELQMPPKDKLSDQEIADLSTWIAMGVPWQAGPGRASSVVVRKASFDLQQRKASHWAWRPVQSPPLPAVKDVNRALTLMDRFVLARLEAKGLKPAPPAEKRLLIRRAYFDLTGLPPTPEAIDAFLNDASPAAFSKVLDGLLASPHFGERWARHWMDLVRYAESYGHEFDYTIANAWQYRDYLIHAFNADVPYNQFVTEQVAGDLLSNPRRNPADGFNESIIGTGFWWFGEQTHSPVDVRQHLADRIDNQIDVFGKTFLGLTVSCARCHDHKFDAISQKDYYSLFSIIESTRRQDALLDDGQIDSAVRQLNDLRHRGDAVIADLLPTSQASAQEFSQYLLASHEVIAKHLSIAEAASPANLDPGRLERWVAALGKDAAKEIARPMSAWVALTKGADSTFASRHERALSTWAEQTKTAQEATSKSIVFKDFHDGTYAGWYASGWAFGDAPTQSGQWDSSTRLPRFALPGLAHSGMLAGRLHGVLRSATFTIEKPQIFYHLKGQGRVHLVIDGYEMDRFTHLLFSGAAFDVDNKDKFLWHRQTGDVGRYIGHFAYIEIADEGDQALAIDQIRFADANAPEPAAAPSALAGRILNDAGTTSIAVLAAAYGSEWVSSVDRCRAGKADADQIEWVNWAIDHGLVTPNASAETTLTEIGRQMDAISAIIPAPQRCQAAADGNGIDDHIFIRGNHGTPGQTAPRRFLEALAGPDQPSLDSQTSGRLELAQRMTDPVANPFVTRVMVNRIWHHLIGRGIVASTDNFGVLGSPPSNPELLDYLADQFVREGWSVKKMIRAVMLSQTYQMDSRPIDPAAEQADPDNVLLHRANLRRLEAEEIRDEILVLSGRLDSKMFGPPVDVFLTPFMEGRGRPKSGPLDGAGRRSIYLGERRNFLSPMMLAFDQPIPFSSMGRRSVSNVPAQALILMNDPFVVAEAKVWASHILEQDGSDARRHVIRMYLTALGREPNEREISQAMAFLQQQATELDIPSERIGSDPALWADFAHALMNVKELIFLR
jgi:hypothetical protein